MISVGCLDCGEPIELSTTTEERTGCLVVTVDAAGFDRAVCEHIAATGEQP